MPKPKRKKNILGFGRGGLFSTSRTYHIDRSKSARPKSRSRARVRDDDDSDSDALLNDIAKGLGGKSYRSLSPSGQATVRKLAGKMSNPKRKRNAELSIPKNKFINAKVRMKGGKLQVMVDQSLLGHASAGGSVSLNPKRKTVKRRKNLFGFGKPKSIEPGDSVKIIRGGERFWVHVTSVRGSKITGTVDNHLELKHPFKFGSRISFGKAGVIDHKK